ncbi:MAG TPA: hypothetical protein VGB77_11285, partial [Abditibacteriaceae bacterium]
LRLCAVICLTIVMPLFVLEGYAAERSTPRPSSSAGPNAASTSPAINSASNSATQTPAPAPLAGLNFLIVALNDIDPATLSARPVSSGGVSLPLVPASGETVRTAPPGLPTASLVPSKPLTAPRVSPAPRAPSREEDSVDPLHPPASIRPLEWPGNQAPFWRAFARPAVHLAQSTPDRILPGPEPRRAVPPDTRPPDFPEAVPPVGVPARPATGIAPGLPGTPAEENNFSSLAPARVSRAQGAAVPLRRALLKAGSVDVLTTGFDGAPILRALNGHRLSQRTLDNLQEAMGRLMVAGKMTADDENLRTVIQNSARLGQALGYRGVITLALLPRTAPNSNGVASPTTEVTYGIVITDALRETGEPLVFDEKGVNEAAMHEAAALTERTVVEKVAAVWKPVMPEEKRQLSLSYLNKAREMIAQTAIMQVNPGEATRLQNEAIDLLNQSLALDVNQVEAYVMLGDMLGLRDSSGAASEYARAAQLKPSDGKVWTKVAIAYTKGTVPDWPRALDAAKRALALGYESAELHLAYAVTQWGRAELFRKSNAETRASEAEADARIHLDRALLLAPQDDPGVMRDIASQLVAQGRYKEGVSVLDRMTRLYPDEKELQFLLAQSLLRLPNQEEAAFSAWSKVWKTQSMAQVTIDPAHYSFVVEGFDRTLSTLGKEASRLAGGVAQGGVPREQALLQMTRLRDDLTMAQDTIKIMVAPTLTHRQNHNSRIFAADLMTQAFGNYIMFLETADTTVFNRATDLHRQAIVTLNLVRAAR